MGLQASVLNSEHMSNDVGPGSTGPSNAAAAQPALTLADQLPGRPAGNRRDRGERNLTRCSRLVCTPASSVAGDVGTSPIYTLRETFGATGHVALTPENILGVLSLIFWALLIVVSGKYVSLILRADNHGEGGVMALTALVLGFWRGSLSVRNGGGEAYSCSWACWAPRCSMATASLHRQSPY